MHDHTRDVPLFAGFVEQYTATALGTGRSYAVSCVGIEAILDWWRVPEMTFPATTLTTQDILQSVLAQAYTTGTVQLRALAGTSGVNSTQAAPIRAGSGGDFSTTTLTIPAGTLRQAIQAVADFGAGGFDTAYTVNFPCTVDFYHGLRFSYRLDAIWAVADYADITVTGTPRPSGTQVTTDSAGTPRAVFVTGGNAAGTGLVTDGTGVAGSVGAISVPGAFSADARNAAGRAWLARNAGVVSTRVTVEDAFNTGSAGSEKRAGMRVTVTDPNIGTTVTGISAQITKTFMPGGLERWTIELGSSLSGAQYLRALTRGQSI
jgi:hypothetical protein